MKIKSTHLRKIVREKLLFEESENTWARFVKELEDIATTSRMMSSNSVIDDIIDNLPEEEKAATREKLEKLREKTIQRVLSKYKDLDISKIPAIIQLAKSKTENEGGSYAENVINIARDYWNTETVQRGEFTTANPENRKAGALAIDKVMKTAWAKEAADHPEFWESFETWHAVGGITGKGDNLDTVLNFYRSFKDTENKDQLSCYGWTGELGNSDEGTLNRGIKSTINKVRGWKTDKIHFKMDGDIKFAASHDIITQWLKLKQGDEEFTKSGDFNRLMGTYGPGAPDVNKMFKFLITGPKDELISGQDGYNEIVIDDWEIGDSVVLNEFLGSLYDNKSMSKIYEGLHEGARKSGKKGQYNLKEISGVDLIKFYMNSYMSSRRSSGHLILFYETFEALKEGKDPDSYFIENNELSMMFIKELYEDGMNVYSPDGTLLNENIQAIFDMRKSMINAFKENKEEVDKLTMSPYNYGKQYIDNFDQKMSDMIKNGFLTTSIGGMNEPIRDYLIKKLGLSPQGLQLSENLFNLYVKTKKDYRPSDFLMYTSYVKDGKTLKIGRDVENLIDAIEVYDASKSSLNQLLPEPKEPSANFSIYWKWRGQGNETSKLTSSKKIAEWMRTSPRVDDILLWSVRENDQKWITPDESPLVQMWKDYLYQKKLYMSSISINESLEYELVLKDLLKI